VGRATARLFAEKGARLGLIARGKEGLEAARCEAEAKGSRALALPLDVADAAAVEEAARRVEEELGPIDIWINNAMVSVFSPIREMKAEEYRRVTEVTYLGYVHGTLAALRYMLPRDRGVIVQVGSALAFRGIPLQSAYCGAKHAIDGFTDSLRCELIHDGSHVRVAAVHLPAMNTPQFSWVKSRLPREPQPVPPIFQPEVAARAIYWAAHHKRRDLLLGWPTVLSVYANRVFPGLLDYYLGKKGYESQQTEEPVSSGRTNNLREPVPGDHGAHGDFDERAMTTSIQLKITTHRSAIAAGIGATVAGVALAKALSAK
jgi:NAD(P)-dependent dehydrogenase (short-subunit alcohol dehydrogenase family)